MKFRLRRYYLYYAGRVLAFIFYLIPLRVGLWIAGLVGFLAYYLLSKYRRITIENLEGALGREKGPQEIRGIAKRVFQNLTRNAVELVNFPRINVSNIDKIVKIENRHILDSALEKGKGIIVVTGHFGNWELMPATLRIKGYHGCVIGRRIYFDRYDKYLNSLREVHDVEIIYRNESPRKILKALKDNRIVGIVADQDVDSVDGVFVNFFGKPAYTPTGPALLAQASGAALIPAFIVHEGGHYTLKIENRIELVDTGDREKDVGRNTQAWSDVIEAYIRRYPDQWVWMHRRWKTKLN